MTQQQASKQQTKQHKSDIYISLAIVIGNSKLRIHSCNQGFTMYIVRASQKQRVQWCASQA